MGGNFGDSAAKEPGSILIEDSGINNIRANRGTTGTLDDAGEAPGGSSSGNFLQTEQVNHRKDAIIKEDTMAPKSETVPGMAPSTSETPDDVKPVTHNKVNQKHPIDEAAGESGPTPKRQKTDHDNASINAANSNHNLDEENGASPPVQQRALEQNSEPEGAATQSHSQILNQGNGQSPSVQQLNASPWGMLGADSMIINEGALGTPWPSDELLILHHSPERGDLIMSLNDFRAFEEALTGISIAQVSVLIGRHFPGINVYTFIPFGQQLNDDLDPEADDDLDPEADDDLDPEAGDDLDPEADDLDPEADIVNKYSRNGKSGHSFYSMD